jgi:tetratricopeptide (TPR) repeat protein
MTGVQILAIVAIALPAAAVVLWPLLRAARPRPVPPPLDASAHRRLELTEEKAALYRALRELAFDREAGHLSEADYGGLRDTYEARAAEVLGALDALGPPPPPETSPHLPEVAEPFRADAGVDRRSWTRHPAALVGGALAMLVFGVVVGLGASRFTAPDPTVLPPGSRIPVTIAPEAAAPPSGTAAATPGAPPPGTGSGGTGSGRPIPPEMLAGMLRAARQSLMEGRYQEAITAYQAVLKRDSGNVDAMTHLGLIVAIGGHADAALETLDRALAIDPGYPPAHLYRGQILYEVKRDYPGAVAAWQRFLALVPTGEEHDRVKGLVQQAQTRQR